MIQGTCDQDCRLWNSCETKWYRGERGEEQVCCPIEEGFYHYNPDFPHHNSTEYTQKLIEVIRHSLLEKKFITAHHFALLLPNKDFYILKTVRDIYTHAFKETINPQVLNEGLVLFRNLLSQVERKADVLINLAYLKEFGDSNDADEAILEALKQEPPLANVIKFYRELMEKQKPDYLKRLSAVSQKAQNITLRKLCNGLEEVNLLLQSKDHNSLLFIIDRLENLISEFRFRDTTEVDEIGKLINHILNTTSKKLENKGDGCFGSWESEEARRYYEGAVKGYRLFTELKPVEPTNFARVAILLNKQLDKLRINTKSDEGKKVVEQIKFYSGRTINLIPQLKDEEHYHACRKYGSIFRILGEHNENEGKAADAISCFQKGAEWLNKALELFKSPKDPIAEMRELQAIAIERGACLRKLRLHDEAIKVYEAVLNRYPNWYQGYLHKGNTLMEIENYEEAEKCFKKCIELKPNDTPAYDTLKILCRQQGRYKEAIRIWVKFMKLTGIKKNKKSLDWGFFELARLWEDAGNDKIAGNLFKYIISRRQPDHLEAHYRLASIYMKHFEWDKAAKVLENKIRIPKNKEPFSDFCYLGDCYKNMGKQGEAIKFYREAESLDYDGPPVLSRLAKFYEEENNFEKAIEYVTKNIMILGEYSTTAENYIWRGDLYRKIGDLPGARQDCLKALELNPLLEKAYQRLDTLPYLIRDTNVVEKQINGLESFLFSIPLDDPAYKKTALSLVQKYILFRKSDNAEKALSLLGSIYSSDSVEYWTSKANILQRLKEDLSGAIECRSKLFEMPSLSEEEKLQNTSILIKLNLDIDRRDKAEELIRQLEKVKSIESLYTLDSQVFRRSTESYELITEILLGEKKDYERALKYANLLLEKIQPDDKVYLTFKGRALIGLGEYADASRVFDFLLSRHPSDSVGHYYKGEVCRKLGALEESKDWFEKGIKLSAEQADQRGIISGLNRLIKIHMKRNEHIKVIEKATELLNIDPTDIVILTNRAMNYYELGQYKESYADFISIFRMRPGDVIGARRLIQILGLKKGTQNNPNTINNPLINTPEFLHNFIERLRESSIFYDNLIQLLDPILKYNISNPFIRSSVAHYLMRYTIYLYFLQPDKLREILPDIIDLFRKSSEGKYFKEFLLDFWGSERGAFLEFYADRYEEGFNKIDRMIGELDLKNLEVEKTKKVVAEITNFREIVKSADFGISPNNIEICNIHLRGLLDYMEKTYREFRFKSRDKRYWDGVKAFVDSLNVDDRNLLDDCIRYTLLQIDALARLPKEDFEKSIAPYHIVKNKLWKVVNALLDGEDLKLSENDRRDINQVRLMTQTFLRTCRFPRFEYKSPLDIYRQVSDIKTIGVPVQFFLEDIDEDDLVYIDPMRIKDCIENLIFNADNAILRKREKFGYNKDDFIHVKFFKENEKFGISCEDRGMGMSLKEKEAFEKGETRGLGALCISKTVEDHEGELYVESKEGEGTKIKIVFPMKEKRDEG